jgi:hypothetical protein
MEPLHLSLDQPRLTPGQEAVARHFGAERRQAYLAPGLVDEEAAESLLCQAYAAADLPPPQRIHWVDGPLELVALLVSDDTQLDIADEFKERIAHWTWESLLGSADRATLSRDLGMPKSVDQRIRRVARNIRTRLYGAASYGLERSIWECAITPLSEQIENQVARLIWGSVARSVHAISNIGHDSLYGHDEYAIWQSISAFDSASDLSYCRFFDAYLALNGAHALSHFNEMVSGYWCGAEVAILVRRPITLECDAEGRLHCATGRAIVYPDGWGFYAWHGVQVPEWVIMRKAPWTREDFFGTGNIEIRRVIQEMMGDQFIWEIGAKFIHSGPRGVLYEVQLPNDPERVARYVQVHDASTMRVYYLRVPPKTPTADDAVAWTFGLTANEYGPLQET